MFLQNSVPVTRFSLGWCVHVKEITTPHNNTYLRWHPLDSLKRAKLHTLWRLWNVKSYGGNIQTFRAWSYDKLMIPSAQERTQIKQWKLLKIWMKSWRTTSYTDARILSRTPHNSYNKLNGPSSKLKDLSEIIITFRASLSIGKFTAKISLYRRRFLWKLSDNSALKYT